MADPTGIGKLAQLPESRSDGKVVRGKDGWLFLDNDSNEFMKQQRGELLFTDEQLDRWRNVLESRVRWLRERGTAYRFLVAPNPHSVYPDKLPFEIPAGTPRPATQLISHLEETGSDVPVVYPLAPLMERRDSPVFTQTNTHWTDLGAFLAYESLMDSIGGEVPVRRLRPDDVRFNEVVKGGDLGQKVEPVESSLHVFATLKKPAARMTHDNRVFLNGHRIDYECPPAGHTVCLVFGDSFAHAMLPFIAESFGRVVFAHLATLDRELVREVAPDIVIRIMNERFLIKVPADDEAKTLKEFEAEKRARGAVYPPRRHEGTRVDTPAPWGEKGTGSPN